MSESELDKLMRENEELRKKLKLSDEALNSVIKANADLLLRVDGLIEALAAHVAALAAAPK